jgi:hypothetical protein
VNAIRDYLLHPDFLRWPLVSQTPKAKNLVFFSSSLSFDAAQDKLQEKYYRLQRHKLQKSYSPDMVSGKINGQLQPDITRRSAPQTDIRMVLLRCASKRIFPLTAYFLIRKPYMATPYIDREFPHPGIVVGGDILALGKRSGKFKVIKLKGNV